MDEIKGLESKNILDAMKEVIDICKCDEHIYCVCVFENITKTSDYKQIIRSDNSFSFYPEESLYNIRRNTQRICKETIEFFEFVAK